MDAKLNHSDLSALLAKEAGLSLAKAEMLTKAVFDIIIEGLEQDGVVKINGLGTFKLTDVASRSSVNVNTGEKFEIKGHRKLVFTPADALKDCVNQPFAMFEPVEVDETYSDDNEEESADVATEENNTLEEVSAEADEVVADEAEPVNQEEISIDVATKTEITEEIPEEQPAEPVEKQQTVQVEENVAEQVQEIVEQPVVEQPKRPEPVMVHVPKKEKREFAVPEKKKSKNHTWLYVVLAVLFVLAVLAVLLILYITPVETHSVRIDTVTRIEYKTDDATEATVVEETITETVRTTDAVTGATVVEESVTKSEHKTDAVTGATVVEESVAKTECKTDAVSGATVDATSGATPLDKELVAEAQSLDSLVAEPAESVAPVEPQEYKFVLVDELASLDLKNVTLADTTMYEMLDAWAEHTVVDHETLTRIALKYYGDKKLWPYIVKYNSLARPDDLRKGMKIVIPKLKPIN